MRLVVHAVALLAIGSLAVFTQEPAFEVVSVKASAPPSAGRGAKGGRGFADPSLFSVRSSPLKRLITMAFDVADYQVSGGPAWIADDRWDVDARPAAPSTREQMMPMLRALLADRFALKVHRETKPMLMNVLSVAKGGPKANAQFHAAKDEPLTGSNGNQMSFPKMTVKEFAVFVDRNMRLFDPSSGPVMHPEEVPPVIDQTGLTGEFDILVRLDTHEDWPAMLEHQLGLKLEQRKIPMEMLVIESASKPRAN